MDENVIKGIEERLDKATEELYSISRQVAASIGAVADQMDRIEEEIKQLKGEE